MTAEGHHQANSPPEAEGSLQRATLEHPPPAHATPGLLACRRHMGRVLPVTPLPPPGQCSLVLIVDLLLGQGGLRVLLQGVPDPGEGVHLLCAAGRHGQLVAGPGEKRGAGQRVRDRHPIRPPCRSGLPERQTAGCPAPSGTLAQRWSPPGELPPEAGLQGKNGPGQTHLLSPLLGPEGS